MAIVLQTRLLICFWKELFCTLLQISLKFVPKGAADNKTAFANGLAPKRQQALT